MSVLIFSVSGYNKAVIIGIVTHCGYIRLTNESIVAWASFRTAIVAWTHVCCSTKSINTFVVAFCSRTTDLRTVAKILIRFFDTLFEVWVARLWTAA